MTDSPIVFFVELQDLDDAILGWLVHFPGTVIPEWLAHGRGINPDELVSNPFVSAMPVAVSRSEFKRITDGINDVVI